MGRDKKHARWSVGTIFRIPNLDDPDETYLTRWRLIETPYFGLYLHRMDGPDSRPTLHDHPWNFLSVVLKGGYLERRLDVKTRRVKAAMVRHFNYKRTHDAHAILELLRVPTWTLVFVGPRYRKWGYLEQSDVWDRWIWTQYDKHSHQTEFDAILEARKG